MRKRLRNTACGLLAGILVLTALPCSARAEEIPADGSYQFTGAEFMLGDEAPEGIYLSELPEENCCRLCLGERLLLPGDVLAQEDFSRLTLEPVLDENGSVELRYYPIRDGILGEKTSLTMQIRSTRNEAPSALDLTLETYKNIPNEGRLRAEDPEEDTLTFQLVDKPRRGSVELREDGSFLYTPKKNKVGEDSFRYTATDSAGNVSNEATVRIRILQPLDAETFDDLGPSEQFPAMWLREEGLYGGTRMTDRLCFCPEQSVSRGEFLTMAMDLAGIEPEIGLEMQLFSDQNEAPAWMQPYLSPALRRGIARGYSTEDGLVFRPNQPITAAEAAAILSRCFHLQQLQTVGSFRDTVPVWAEGAVAALEEAGVALPCAPEAALCRRDAALLLYQALSAQG